jgi:N utilization substance protein B
MTPAPAIAPRKANKRGAARLAAVQALWQMEVAGRALHEVFAEFETFWIGQEVEGAEYLPAENAYFRSLVETFVERQRTLDPLIDKALEGGWPLPRLEAILRALLRIGACELASKPDVPARVIVTEYVDIASAFLDRDAVGMANGVLDRLARRLRAKEFEEDRARDG